MYDYTCTYIRKNAYRKLGTHMICSTHRDTMSRSHKRRAHTHTHTYAYTVCM